MEQKQTTPAAIVAAEDVASATSCHQTTTLIATHWSCDQIFKKYQNANCSANRKPYGGCYNRIFIVYVSALAESLYN
jgi:hypothetical protein